jgi:antitoxin CcdA
MRTLDAHIMNTSKPKEKPMLRFENAPKKATNLSLNASVLEAAKAMGMNISQTVDTLLADEVKRRYWEKWRDDNKDAFQAYNERIQREGLPLAKYRSFGQSLGDGKSVATKKKAA